MASRLSLSLVQRTGRVLPHLDNYKHNAASVSVYPLPMSKSFTKQTTVRTLFAALRYPLQQILLLYHILHGEVLPHHFHHAMLWVWEGRMTVLDANQT